MLEALNLKVNDLTGPVPPIIFNMCKLYGIYFGSNHNLTGPKLGNENSGLPTLEQITIHYNSFISQIQLRSASCRYFRIVGSIRLKVLYQHGWASWLVSISFSSVVIMTLLPQHPCCICQIGIMHLVVEAISVEFVSLTTWIHFSFSWSHTVYVLLLFDGLNKILSCNIGILSCSR